MPESKEKKKEAKNTFKNLIWVLKLNFKYFPFMTIARILGFINQYASGLINSFIMGILIDGAIKYVNHSADSSQVIYGLGIYGAFYLLRTSIGAIRNYSENLASPRLNWEVPELMLLAKMGELSTASIESPEIQNKITRYRENRYAYGNMTRSLFNIIGVVVTFIIAIVPVINLYPTIALVLIIAAIPSLILNKTMIDRLWKIDKDTTVLNRRGWNMSYMISNPASLKEVKLLNAYEYLKKYFLEYANTFFNMRKGVYTQWSLIGIIFDLIYGVLILIGIYFVIDSALNGLISIGQIAFFTAALLSIGSQLDTFAIYIAEYMGMNTKINEMKFLLDYKEIERPFTKKVGKLANPPLIKLNNISFKYPNQKKSVIKNLNLEIKPGEKIAIVGENGAGKTTLVKLISNIYAVTSGEILVDNSNLNEIEPSTWYENLGVLYQDYNTYTDLTAKDNIALGQPDEPTNIKAVIDAAKKADAHEFIMDYKDKFDQILSERYEGGIRPSTGQWQKIAIARFFYRNAPILILDEPTASIDAVAEANIFDRIYKFIENKTVIIISHRFSTVRNADRIIVMDKGEIVEQGTHKELLALNGMYANAYNTQAKGYRD